MSWQAYVDDQLVGAGLQQGVIIGLDGNPWATSKGFALKAGEGAKVVKGFSDPASVLGGGLLISGNKYLAIKADPRSIYAKKGAGGVVAVQTGSAVIIRVYNETIQPGQRSE
eukprot:TRINITY_DN743_c0_g1_i1.p1 TRINITY_DN743_c0_g1~~TRINITY_DN743_c0_g1_i1.p1  ORF type:complete len:112 (-),score=23.76 TRINITY_DN743_c0_g1_i1:54-389(-)